MQAKQSLLDADAEAAEEIAAANADLASTKQSLLAAEAAATGGASKLRDELSLALKDAVTAKQSLLDAEAEAAEALTAAEGKARIQATQLHEAVAAGAEAAKGQAAAEVARAEAAAGLVESHSEKAELLKSLDLVTSSKAKAKVR